MRKQINEGYQEKRYHALDVIEYYDWMTSEGHVLSPEQREQLTDVVAFLKDTDDGSNPVTDNWIKLGRAVLKRNANKWKGGSMVENKNKNYTKMVNIDKCITESIHKVLNEAAGHYYYKDDDGTVYTSSKETWRGVPDTTFIFRGDWADPTILYKGKEINCYDVEDGLWETYKDECEENGETPTNDGYEKWLNGLDKGYLQSELDNYVVESVRRPVNETAEDDWNDTENADEDMRYEMGEFAKAMQKENGTYKASSKDGKFNTGDKVIVHLTNGNNINGVISDIDTNFMTYEEQFDIDYVDENGTKKTMICVPASKVEKVLKEEVDMGQVPAVSDKRSTAADIPDNVRKEIRKLRQQIGEFDDEGKDTTELQKRLKELKNKYFS